MRFKEFLAEAGVLKKGDHVIVTTPFNIWQGNVINPGNWSSQLATEGFQFEFSHEDKIRELVYFHVVLHEYTGNTLWYSDSEDFYKNTMTTAEYNKKFLNDLYDPS
jgi:hypothetical protein